jgi:hypothetical protein
MAAATLPSVALSEPFIGSYARCQVAEAALENLLPPQETPEAETVKYLDKDVGGFPPIDLNNYDLSNKKSWDSKNAPSPELVQSFIQQKQIAALNTCSALEEFAGIEGWTTGPGARIEIRKIWDMEPGDKNFGRRQGLVVVLLTPVVSVDGQEALVEWQAVCGHLCGLGSVVYFRKDVSGHWMQVAIRELWAS